LSEKHGVAIQLTADEVEGSLDEDLALCFFRVAQEALNNSLKYSGSSRVEVRLTAIDGTLRMTVKDFGSGFDPSATANGLGLATMRERLRLVEGKLVINSRMGEGTEVTAQARLATSSRRRERTKLNAVRTRRSDRTAGTYIIVKLLDGFAGQGPC
jgi:signal transduction histidine kinase